MIGPTSRPGIRRWQVGDQRRSSSFSPASGYLTAVFWMVDAALLTPDGPFLGVQWAWLAIRADSLCPALPNRICLQYTAPRPWSRTLAQAATLHQLLDGVHQCDKWE